MSPFERPRSLAQGLVHGEVGERPRHLDALHQRTRDFIAREQTFTAGASHEVRNPLAVLGLAIERLRQQAPLAQQTVLTSMQAALWQLQQTVELLLALAREAPTDVRVGAPAQEQLLLPVQEQTLLAHAPLLVDSQTPFSLRGASPMLWLAMCITPALPRTSRSCRR